MGVPLFVGDRVLVQTTTPGTGTYQLGPALDGFFTASAGGVVSGRRVSYVVVDDLQAPTQVEVGEGIFTEGSPPQITRAVIKRSTAANAAINWGVGTRYLMLTPHAGLLALLDSDGRLPPSTLPVTPTSRLLLTSSTAVPNNTVTYITHQQLVEGSLAGAATVPTAGYTAPASGSGRLVLNCLMSGGAGGGAARRGLILRDGAIIAQMAAPPSAENHPFSLSWEGYVTAGQQFLAAVRQDSGGALQVTSSEFSFALTGG